MQLFFEMALRPLLYAALVAMIFVPLEELAPLRQARRRHFRTDVLFATVGAVFVQCSLYVAAGGLLALADHLGRAGPLSGAPGWLSLPLSLLVFELGSYAYHRAAHRCGPLWRLHAVHHSAGRMDWLAGFRQHPLEVMLMTAAQNLPLVLLGLPIESHFVLVLLLRLNTLWVHSNVASPRWLSAFVATPSFHHRHHDRDASAANFATLFPFLDRLFGTFSAEPSETFGLAGPDAGTSAELGFVALVLLRLGR